MCVTASFQRCHARAAFLPAVVASWWLLVVASRMAGAWLVVASVHDSSVDFFSILTRLDAGTLTTPTLDAVPARARRLSVWGDIIRLAAISRAKPAAERCRATVEPNGCLSARASNGGFSGFCAERERARARFLTLRPAVSSFAGESLVRRWPGLDSSGTLRWRKGSLRSRS